MHFGLTAGNTHLKKNIDAPNVVLPYTKEMLTTEMATPYIVMYVVTQQRKKAKL